MARDPDQNLFYNPPGTTFYNIRFKGNVVQSRVTIRAFRDVKPELIESVWIITEKRQATLGEIRALCAPVRAHGRQGT